MPGDVIVLTKPLGTQIAVNLFQWRKKPEKWQRVADIVSIQDADDAFNMASESMSRLNLNAARMMHKVRCVGFVCSIACSYSLILIACYQIGGGIVLHSMARIRLLM